jgi:hypothetical protein
MELVVSIVIAAIVLVFVSMFMAAPIDAYAAQSRRAALVASPSDAWPRLERDLRTALPNSVRWRRNGAFVVLEMLPVTDEARYLTTPGASFDIAGTGGVYHRQDRRHLGVRQHVPTSCGKNTPGLPLCLTARMSRDCAVAWGTCPDLPAVLTPPCATRVLALSRGPGAHGPPASDGVHRRCCRVQ